MYDALSISNYYYTEKGEIFEKGTVRPDGSIRFGKKVKNFPYSLLLKLKEEYLNQQNSEQLEEERCDLNDNDKDTAKNLKFGKSPASSFKKYWGTRRASVEYQLHRIDYGFPYKKLPNIYEIDTNDNYIEEYGTYWDKIDENEYKIDDDDDDVIISDHLNLSVHIIEITEDGKFGDSELISDFCDSGFGSSASDSGSEPFRNRINSDNSYIESETSTDNDDFEVNLTDIASFKEALSNKKSTCWNDFDSSIDILCWGIQNTLVIQ